MTTIKKIKETVNSIPQLSGLLRMVVTAAHMLKSVTAPTVIPAGEIY